MRVPLCHRVCALALVSAIAALVRLAAQQPPAIPSTPLAFGAFTATFDANGTFSLQGPGWPGFKGSYKTGTREDGKTGSTIELLTPDAAGGCDKPARYGYTVQDGHVSFALVADDCVPRRMILDRSEWRPWGEPPRIAERKIARTLGPATGKLPAPALASGSWPSFRGPQASGVADGQNLPDRWDVATGENVLWRTPVPGLAHSSPIVWGGRIFVTSAVSTNPNASFRPGLYGDGDASEDRSPQKWTIYAIDRGTGRIVWERVAAEGVPADKRHIKSTYASATPATNGRLVVASFGSQGVFAYDVNGTFRWKVDLGRMNMGAYDIPTYEWGPASSPILWNGLVIVQVDTQADSFIIALKEDTGAIAWKTARAELPSWGTPTVAVTPAGPRLVTNASNYVRGYDPMTGRELWRLGGSSKITAPTPVFADGVFVVASGRAPERPIFVIRADARGDITPPAGQTRGGALLWSRTGRGSYMPTPLVYRGILYVLANNGVFDAYDLATGDEIYRQRLEKVGNGFSASPVAADGRIYLSNEDGDLVVVEAGRTFKQIATNQMGELVMATPALSNGVMYVRTAKSLVAIGRR
jgi:outer membrane protein assembly factor BamB